MDLQKRPYQTEPKNSKKNMKDNENSSTSSIEGNSKQNLQTKNVKSEKIKKRKRCIVCRSKAPTNIICKCGKLVCLSHRYADSHDCAFDEKTAHKNRLSKEMPKIEPEKLCKF